MPTLLELSYIIDGEEINPTVTNRPLLEIYSNQLTLNDYIDGFSTYNPLTGVASIKHDGVDMITTSDDGVDFNAAQLKNIGEPVDNDDATTKEYVDDIAASLSTGASGTTVAAENGYQIFPSGITIQWGTDTSTIDGVETFTFNIPFTTAYNVQLNRRTPNANYDIGPTDVTNTGFSINRHDGIDSDEDFYWVAIGFITP